MNLPFSSPKAIAEVGEKIYAERYKDEYERDHVGKFAAINVLNGQAFLGDTPEAALEWAKQDSPNGLFHLIQVGFPGAFRVSYANHVSVDRIFC